jgi:chemotaxis protein CheD
MARNDFEQEMAPTRYFDRQFGCEAVKILPGEYFITNRETLIVTVLGSCVSVCLRDKVSGAGGMNHFMLPDSEACSSAIGNSARYGTYAMEMLIDQLLKLGAQRANLQAKVFGGGRVLNIFNANNIGDRNVSFVRSYLKTEQIPVIAEDLLDIYPRKVYFFPDSGRVLVRKIKSLNNRTILDREFEYGRKLQQTPMHDDFGST